MIRSNVYNETMNYIHDMISQQFDLGCALISTGYDGHQRKYDALPALCNHPYIRKFLRHMCKEHKRPFVHAEDSYGGVIILYIPNQKRLQPIMAPLFMVSSEYSGWGRNNGEPITWRNNQKSLVIFTFHENRDVFYNWRRTLSAAPEFRKILRLEVNDESVSS
jgi:hypothetical protein